MAFTAVVETDYVTLDADFEAFIVSSDALVITLTPRETGTLMFNIDSAGTTDDVEVRILQGHLLTSGTLDLDTAASTTDVELMTASDPITTDDDLNGTYIIMTSGTAQGNVRLITDSVAADDGIVPEHAFSASIAAADTYHRYAFDGFTFVIDATTAISDDSPMSKGITIHGAHGQKVVVTARSKGATDAHRIKMSYQTDGVSA